MIKDHEENLPARPMPMLNKNKEIIRSNQDIYYSSHMLNKLKELNGLFSSQLPLLLKKENAFNELLSHLPPAYPVSQLLVAGSLLNVSEFININKENGLAFFLDESQLITVEANQISAIIW